MNLRVVDLTDELGVFSTRLLVGIGADVVRLERRGGDPLRRQDVGEIAYGHWNAGKRSLELDLDADRELLFSLLRQSDVVVESSVLGATAPDLLDPEAVASENPNIVHAVITPFGRSGPRAHWCGTDLIGCAAGGMTWMTGSPDEPPLVPPREQGYHLSSVNAALGVMLGLVARARTGTGQLVDISMQECVAATLEYGAVAFIHQRSEVHRSAGRYPHVPHRVYECADGFVAGGFGGSPRMWSGLLAMLVDAGAARDLEQPRWSREEYRLQHRPEIEAVVEQYTRTQLVDEFIEDARSRRLPWAPVDTPSSIAFNPQLVHRHAFSTVEWPDVCARDNGFAFDFPGRPRPVRLKVPRLEPSRSRDGADPWRSPNFDRQTSTSVEQDNGSGIAALSGVRVLDLTWVLAGPYATKILADHGADVIKIESRHRPDPTRFSKSMHFSVDPEAGPDSNGYFNNFNRNKRSVALNLRHPAAREVLNGLVMECDVVVENFSAGVLDKLGLGYTTLRSLREDVILVSMSGFGHSGPGRDLVSYADTLAALGGFTNETKDADSRPIGLNFGLGDMVAGLHAAFGALAALEFRTQTGLGQHIDLSQLEAVVAHTGTSLLEQAFAIDGLAYHGNRHARMCPHNVYPCRDEDDWCAIAVATESQWTSLASLIGSRELVGNAELATASGRAKNARAIDDLVEQWTCTRSAADAAETLQARGIPAAPVQTPADLVLRDHHLAARGFFVDVHHPAVGSFLHEGVCARLSVTPGGIRHAAPCLGEHTRDVLRDLLDLTDAEIDRLAEAGALE